MMPSDWRRNKKKKEKKKTLRIWSKWAKIGHQTRLFVILSSSVH